MTKRIEIRDDLAEHFTAQRGELSFSDYLTQFIVYPSPKDAPFNKVGLGAKIRAKTTLRTVMLDRVAWVDFKPKKFEVEVNEDETEITYIRVM
jgi:hypothetical protein